MKPSVVFAPIGMADPGRAGLSVEDVYKRVEDMSRLH